MYELQNGGLKHHPSIVHFMRYKEEDILKQLQTDPQLGFRSLMAKYMRPIYWHVRCMVVSHDDAEDITQETFVRIFKSIGNFRGDCALSSWIYRIATNEALRALNSRKDCVGIDDAGPDVFNLKADEYIDYHHASEVKLQKAIHSLPTKQQLTFNLRYYDEMEYSEIAEIIGATAITAKVNYHLAKRKIIEYMNSNE